MSRGRQGGETAWTAGAWLATTTDDGMVRRERLLTFNPFHAAGRSHGSDGPLTPGRIAAWNRERNRMRRAQGRAA